MNKKKKENEINEEKKDNIKSVDKLAEAREKRKLAWEAKQKNQKSGDENHREEFRKFFIKVKNKLSLDKSMEEILWIHFKRSGFDKKDKFEEGIKNFGYNL